jgi:alkylhydroperoxidase family enzyme
MPLPQPNSGPCADVVAALAGSPAAHTVRTVVDEALGSPILPRRTKLLMLAVIGRALGCDHSEEEARAQLLGEGFTAADLDEVLANLGSPKLDRRDALLVPFARETVRYQVTSIQRRTRELARALSTEEVIEAVGIAALANAVGRLSVLLETC